MLRAKQITYKDSYGNMVVFRNPTENIIIQTISQSSAVDCQGVSIPLSVLQEIVKEYAENDEDVQHL